MTDVRLDFVSIVFLLKNGSEIFCPSKDTTFWSLFRYDWRTTTDIFTNWRRFLRRKKTFKILLKVFQLMNHPHPRLYSMEWEPHNHCLYFVLNGTLRTKDRQKLKPCLLYLRLILNAFSRLPSQGCHVYRGVLINLSEN